MDRSTIASSIKMQYNSTKSKTSRREQYKQKLVSSMSTNWPVDLRQDIQQAALWCSDKTRNKSCINETARRLFNKPATQISSLMLICLLFLVALFVGAQADPSSTSPAALEVSGHNKENHSGDQSDVLQAELNSIIQKHDALEESNKQLAEAIISRLMVDNLNNNESPMYLTGNSYDSLTDEPSVDELAAMEAIGDSSSSSLTEAAKTKKLLNLLSQYENAIANSRGANGGQPYTAFPVLPFSQAATMKRAAMKMGSYLQQQRARQNYDFGLGKRPDTSSNSVLRFGESVQPVSQFGKRPSGHRFDFGLGKRVASPAYPRYDFGLGKRAPNRIRYDFGLG